MGKITSISEGHAGLPIEPTQSGVIPFRVAGDGVEFCLITTRKSGRWGFPKGTVPRGKTLEQAALLEASEEAGISGRIIDANLGGFSYRKRSSVERVRMMLMEVQTEADSWLEKNERQRRWTSPAEAMSLLDRPPLIRLLLVACERLEVSPLVLGPLATRTNPSRPGSEEEVRLAEETSAEEAPTDPEVPGNQGPAAPTGRFGSVLDARPCDAPFDSPSE